MPRRQSNNQWIGGIAAHPATQQKVPSAKIRSIFLGSRWHPPHWLSSKGPNYQRGVLLISAGATEGHFEGKKPREDYQEGLVLARQYPGTPGTCNPKETGLPGLPMSWSPYSPDLALSDYHLFPGLKKQLKGGNFLSDAEVIAAAETWLDGQILFFFWVACRSKSNRLRSIFSFVGSTVNKSRVWSL